LEGLRLRNKSLEVLQIELQGLSDGGVGAKNKEVFQKKLPTK
jgi:hypothetical protein